MSEKAKGNIISITGASGAGRSTVVAVLKNSYPNFVTATGVTTRAARPGEVEGQHYYFVTVEAFEQDIKNDRFISWQQHMDNYYGIYKSTVTQLLADGKTVILEFSLGEEINAVKKLYPNANTISMHIIPHDVDSMVRRLIVRENKDMDRVYKRLNVYEAEAYTALKADVILVNEDSEETAKTIARIVDNPESTKKYYDEYVELVVQIKKALKEYKADSRFTIRSGYIQKYSERSEDNKLYDVEIPAGVTGIGANAFNRCTNLRSITIPQGVNDIENGAFRACRNLESIVIPRSVHDIGEEVFDGCHELSSVSIMSSPCKIGSGLFKDCKKLENFRIPDSVTCIGECAFGGCSSLSTISIPDNVCDIGKYAFAECVSLSGVSISDKVNRIGDFAFACCRELMHFNIPKAVRYVSPYLFDGCINLQKVTMHTTSVETIGAFAFHGCRNLKNIVLPTSTVEIEACAFDSCVSLEDIVFSDNITKIGAYAFYDCASLSSLSLPNGLARIEQGTFAGCVSLTEVTLPSNLYIIGNRAFSGCKKLNSITVPKGVRKIEQYAFENCTYLRSIEIPESVVAIEDHAFDGCYALKIKTVPGSFAERYAKENQIDVEYNSADSETLIEYLDRRLDRIESNQKTNQRIVQETQRTIISIDKKQDELLWFVKKDLQEWLKKEKSRFATSVLLQDPEQVEVATAASVLKSNNYINQQVSSATQLIEDATKHLRTVFGPTWDDLLPATQTSLISAGVLWESCSGIEDQDFDYSGICIATTSALEGVLKHYFYTGFQQYMIERYQKPSIENIYSDWPEELLDTKYYVYRKILDEGGTPEVNIGTNFTMGTLPYLFHSKKTAIVRKRMNEYLCTILKPSLCSSDNDKWWAINALDVMTNLKDGERDSNSFVSRCERIRNVYRNPAAHSGIVSRETAEACTDAIVGRVEAFKHNMEVQGLLMELYSMLK